MRRRETIEALLGMWDDLATPLGGGGEGGGSDGLTPMQAHERHCGVYSSLRCTCFLLGVVELDRCLRRLRTVDPSVYRHVAARYGDVVKVRLPGLRYQAGSWRGLASNEAVIIPAWVPGQQQGRREGMHEPVLIVRWPDWVRLGVVEQALRWLELEFVGEPQLPREAAA